MSSSCLPYVFLICLLHVFLICLPQMLDWYVSLINQRHNPASYIRLIHLMQSAGKSIEKGHSGQDPTFLLRSAPQETDMPPQPGVWDKDLESLCWGWRRPVELCLTRTGAVWPSAEHVTKYPESDNSYLTSSWIVMVESDFRHVASSPSNWIVNEI